MCYIYIAHTGDRRVVYPCFQPIGEADWLLVVAVFQVRYESGYDSYNAVI